MPRKPMPWFRFYVEAIDDDKLVRHPPEICWLWTAMMALARKSAIPGYLLISEGTPHSVETIAHKSRVPAKKVREALLEFEKDGMVVRDENLGCWVVANFKRRQFVSDDVAQRTAKHRSKEQRWNVPTNDEGTSAPLVTENRYQNPDPPPPTGHSPRPGLSPAEAAFCHEVISELAQRQLRASRTQIVNPSGWLAKARASIEATHLDTVRAAHADGRTVVEAADLVDPPAPKPVAVHQSFHALACVCGGQGTDRTCSGVELEGAAR